MSTLQIQSVTWAQDVPAESHLRKMGVAHREVDRVHISEIDVEVSRRNNARLRDRYDESLAMEYADAMADGAAFPKLILVKKSGKSKKYLVISGNHRLGAAIQLQQLTVAAYVLDEWDDQINDLIARSANRWTGKRQTAEEAVEHARHMMSAYGMNASEVARYFGLRAKWLQGQLRALDVKSRCQKLHLNTADVPVAIFNKLHTIRMHSQPFAEAAKVVCQPGVTTDQASRIVDAVAKEGDDEARIKGLTRVAEEVAKENRFKSRETDRPKSLHRRNALRLLNSLHRFLEHGNEGSEFSTWSQLQITSQDERAEMAEKSRKVIKHLTRLLGAKS